MKKLSQKKLPKKLTAIEKNINISDLAAAFKALSNPNRLQLYLDILKKNRTSFESCEVCFLSDIAVSLKINPPTISHHLKELVGADLVITEKRGKQLICKINEDTLEQIKKALPV